MAEENGKRYEYFITLVSKDCKGIMCIGYVDDENTAKQAVENNVANICNHARYVVIEKVMRGLFCYDLEPLVYSVTGGNVRLLKQVPNSLKARYGKGIGFGIKID